MVKNYLKWEVHSLDPIHIFASFNYPGIDRELRIKKLRLYFRLLGSELEYENINFKGSIELVPSYKYSTFDNDNKFKLYFDDACNTEKINLYNIKVVLKSDDIVYRKYISTFKFYNRYQNHTPVVKDLILKSQKYSKIKLEQMARIIKKPLIEIKNDISGSEVFIGDLGDVPLSKLKIDIYNKYV
jgi:hypothetical protein